tara:strand:+ start:105 stop:278 length:174 start_codon:yes stop_codon:yes gene_type:complete
MSLSPPHQPSELATGAQTSEPSAVSATRPALAAQTTACRPSQLDTNLNMQVLLRMAA